jgi:SAM-dependent methyltransferase
MNTAEIQTVVQDWIDHQLLGEPEGFTALRQEFVEQQLARCRRVLELIPDPPERGRLLELGAGVYVMTFLLEHFRNYDLELVQYWNMPNGEYASVLVDQRTGQQRVLPFQQFNAEVDMFPYPEASFDVILVCEIIEHLLSNPVHMLAECHRVLKPGGLVLLTTPNALRLSNVLGLLRGRNIYDRYYHDSLYARHAREYSPEEVQRLFEEVGFHVTHLETLDVTGDTLSPWSRRLVHTLLGLTNLAARVQGQQQPLATRWRHEQIFLVAERAGAVRHTLPDFLFQEPGLVPLLADAICQPRQTVEAKSLSR